ncbi:hypothetical protein GCM10023306_17210 [Novosphingobium ginsenosidimutans]
MRRVSWRYLPLGLSLRRSGDKGNGNVPARHCTFSYIPGLCHRSPVINLSSIPMILAVAKLPAGGGNAPVLV